MAALHSAMPFGSRSGYQRHHSAVLERCGVAHTLAT